MLSQLTPPFLAVANHAYRAGESTAAMRGYVNALLQMPELGQAISANIARTRQQYRAGRLSAERPRIVICGWELAHNPAGRVHTLAEISQEFADVEIVGSILVQWGSSLWEPMRDTQIPVDSFLAIPNRFFDQALELVAAHPADIVLLSKPRAPNILFGVLYKLLWGTRVILDIDEEELVFVQADSPIDVDDYLKQQLTLPAFDQIAGSDWTRIAVGLAQEFDAITVSNVAVQARYGGEIIGHARNHCVLNPSPELRHVSRQALGIRPDQKVILFSGTPRPHKGLLEVAQAIQSLRRNDVLFVISGSFAPNQQAFKAQLQAVSGVNFLFLENQPLSALPRILAIADCCVLLQELQHPFSKFQIPAKLTDALAMRIPVIATPTPALAGPLAAGAFIPASPDNLASQLADTLDHPNISLVNAGRQYFDEHLSIAVNAKRLMQGLDKTSPRQISPALRGVLTGLPVNPLLLHALSSLAEPKAVRAASQSRAQQLFDAAITGNLAIAVHIYYLEIWPEIAQRLKALRYPYVLDITSPPELVGSVEAAVKQDFPAARIHTTPNFGMDICPFLSLVPQWQQEGILAVCKLHTKRGDGGDVAAHWRKYLLDSLIGHPDIPVKIARAFADNPHLDLVGPATLYLSGQRLMYQNEPALRQINLGLGRGPLPETDWGFFAGTMFWARPAALAPLCRLETRTDPQVTNDYARDGQYEHALERAFGLIPHRLGGRIGLLHSSISTTDTPQLQIVEALAPSTSQLINPSDISRVVRQTFSLVDWDIQCRKRRQIDFVSIVIPVFNQPELTAACIASIYQHTTADLFELVLVDNGSDAPTQTLLQSLAHKYANLRLLRNRENLNFARGCNLGFASSNGEIVIFLNNDTTVTQHWLQPLVEALQRPEVAAVQPKLLYPDGTIQCVGIVFSSKSPLGYPIYAGMQPQRLWANRSRMFQAVTGACMAMRANDFAEMHGFDDAYINGQEDVDLCLRLKERYQSPCAWVAAESTVIHHESKTPNRFNHVAHNRRTYVRRWSNRVKADDQSYYVADGFRVEGYGSGSPNSLPEDLQVFRARIAPSLRLGTVPPTPTLSKNSQ